jgi:hypothetical protein
VRQNKKNLQIVKRFNPFFLQTKSKNQPKLIQDWQTGLQLFEIGDKHQNTALHNRIATHTCFHRPAEMRHESPNKRVFSKSFKLRDGIQHKFEAFVNVNWKSCEMRFDRPSPKRNIRQCRIELTKRQRD